MGWLWGLSGSKYCPSHFFDLPLALFRRWTNRGNQKRFLGLDTWHVPLRLASCVSAGTHIQQLPRSVRKGRIRRNGWRQASAHMIGSRSRNLESQGEGGPTCIHQTLTPILSESRLLMLSWLATVSSEHNLQEKTT